MEDRNPNTKLEHNPWINENPSLTTMASPSQKAQIIDLTLDSAPPSPISSPRLPPDDATESRPTVTSLFQGTLNFGSEKISQFIASGIPQQAAMQVGSAALTTSLFVAKMGLDVVQTTASYGFTKLKESVIPSHVADFLSVKKKGRRRQTSWEKLPTDVYKWCRVHPKELSTLGYVFADGMLVYNPTMLIGALGMQRKAVLGVSVATKVRSAVGVASSIPVALKAIEEVRKGGVGKLGAAAVKLAMRKTRREKRGRKRRS